MKFRIVDAANEDIAVAAYYYEGQEPLLGEEFADIVQEFIRELCRIPQKFARLERFPRGRDIREGMTTRFPYIVVYTLETDFILIVSVFHTSRNPIIWRGRI